MKPPPWVDGEPLPFAALEGFENDDLDCAFETFLRSAKIHLEGAPELRPALAPPPSLLAASRAALSHKGDARGFFTDWFAPFRVKGDGFLTGYYEVEVEARRSREPGFATPVLPRPRDLETLNEAPLLSSGVALTSARRRSDGRLEPFEERSEIEQSDPSRFGEPIAWLRDPVELFLIQVQGSARLRFPDGPAAALTYDGRNGHPYSSVGRLLIERGAVPAERMSLETLKEALRRLGQKPGEEGRLLMQQNKSYVFFRLDTSSERALGPIGGQGAPLVPLRSIAVDRGLWPYGLPFFIRATVPWEGGTPTAFARLMIAQDTGSAILGPARADLYFGTGPHAGSLAGGLRHGAEFTALLPLAHPA
ncbi:murein transglycosylase A [Methylocystis heyeri]|uniref:peptidoglycan lytic exotransglycosylase n=1 Tax=Methylocystis heyeri TaxID=391905 RepID=A0A6B8KF52_9HYPH|nr:MltA domain-containing protein [Methylocystis heyeri]QGM46926.1 transglycosylase [Methylocystis heyeri]